MPEIATLALDHLECSLARSSLVTADDMEHIERGTVFLVWVSRWRVYIRHLGFGWHFSRIGETIAA